MPLGSILRGRPARGRVAPAGDLDLASDRDLLDRFTRHNDQQAFAALVRRHGPPVLGVCRRVLRDPHAADDAFQATFMVLARKASAIARPDALAGWLHGVAVRVACKARAAGSRPTPGPLPDPAVEPPDPAAGLAGEELRLILDEELCRLPNRDRDLVVLVYLEGKTHDEAARAVGCPLGSVAWRLTKAREDLRKRLVRRGVSLSVGLLLLLASISRAQAVSESLIGRAAAAARRPGPGAPGTGGILGRRMPLGCLLPLAALLAAAGAAFGWSSLAAHPGKKGPPAVTAPDSTPGGAEAPPPASSCH